MGDRILLFRGNAQKPLAEAIWLYKELHIHFNDITINVIRTKLEYLYYFKIYLDTVCNHTFNVF